MSAVCISTRPSKQLTSECDRKTEPKTTRRQCCVLSSLHLRNTPNSTNNKTTLTQSSNIDPHTRLSVFDLHFLWIAFLFSTLRSPEQHTACFSSVAHVSGVCRCTMVLKRGIVRWLAVEGCIRGLIPVGAGKSTLVRGLQHRDDVIVVRGMPCW